MSAADGTVDLMTRPHPWRDLRALAHVTLHLTADLGPGVWGATDGARRIWLDTGLTQRERRSTLAHELEHLRRGHTGCQDPATERAVEAAAARYLLPEIREIADALVWAGCHLDAAADELWVDEQLLRARLEHLHPAERAILVERLGRVEVWA